MNDKTEARIIKRQGLHGVVSAHTRIRVLSLPATEKDKGTHNTPFSFISLVVGRRSLDGNRQARN